MAESFDIDEKSNRLVQIGQDSLDKYGYDSAKEMVREALERLENDSEQDGKRRFSRGYQGSDSE